MTVVAMQECVRRFFCDDVELHHTCRAGPRALPEQRDACQRCSFEDLAVRLLQAWEREQ